MFWKRKKKPLPPDPNAPFRVKLSKGDGYYGADWYVDVYKGDEHLFGSGVYVSGSRGMARAQEEGEAFVKQLNKMGGMEYEYRG